MPRRNDAMSTESDSYFVDETLAGRTALITGGGGGMGKAMIDAFLQQGCTIIVAQRREIVTRYRDVHFISCDLGDRASIQSLIEDATKINGGVDILINNAATNFNADLRSVDLDAWDRLLQVNLTAPLQLAAGLLGGMKEKKWGRVINISSISAYDNTPFNMLYAATKSALQSFTRAWARQMASSGVTVNAVTPGFTETPFTEALSSHASREAITAFEAYERVFRTYVPTRRSVLPAEIASAVLFLCSKYSGSITGDVINVSGGQFMTA